MGRARAMRRGILDVACVWDVVLERITSWCSGIDMQNYGCGGWGQMGKKDSEDGKGSGGKSGS